MSDILFLVITQYWNVVLNRQAYEVQKKSFEEAQKSYEHDKKASAWALCRRWISTAPNQRLPRGA
ncbi:MAG TPA: hypothetical protein VGF61_06880 [Candidatus Acidoferrum sp.]